MSNFYVVVFDLVAINIIICKDVNQLNRILEVAGFPSEKLLNNINEEARNFLERSQIKPKRVNFAEYFHEISSPLGIRNKSNLSILNFLLGCK